MKKNEKVYIHFQVDTDFKKELEEEAKSKGLALNAYIRMILIERNK